MTLSVDPSHGAMRAGTLLMADLHAHFGLAVARDLYAGLIRHAGAFAGSAVAAVAPGAGRDAGYHAFNELSRRFEEVFGISSRLGPAGEDPATRMLARFAGTPVDRSTTILLGPPAGGVADSSEGFSAARTTGFGERLPSGGGSPEETDLQQLGRSVLLLARELMKATAQGTDGRGAPVHMDVADVSTRAELAAFVSAGREIVSAAHSRAQGADGVTSYDARRKVARRVLDAYGSPDPADMQSIADIGKGWALGIGAAPDAEAPAGESDPVVDDTRTHNARMRIARDLAADDGTGNPGGKVQQDLAAAARLAADTAEGPAMDPIGGPGVIARATATAAAQVYIRHLAHVAEAAPSGRARASGPNEQPGEASPSETYATRAYITGPLTAASGGPSQAPPADLARTVADPQPYLEAAVSAAAFKRVFPTADRDEQSVMIEYAERHSGGPVTQDAGRQTALTGRTMLASAKTGPTSLASTFTRATENASLAMTMGLSPVHPFAWASRRVHAMPAPDHPRGPERPRGRERD